MYPFCGLGRGAQGDGGGGAAERRGAAAAGHHGGDGSAAGRPPEPVRSPARWQRRGDLRGGLPALVLAGADRPLERAAAPDTAFSTIAPFVVAFKLKEMLLEFFCKLKELIYFFCLFCHCSKQSNSTLFEASKKVEQDRFVCLEATVSSSRVVDLLQQFSYFSLRQLCLYYRDYGEDVQRAIHDSAVVTCQNPWTGYSTKQV